MSTDLTQVCLSVDPAVDPVADPAAGFRRTLRRQTLRRALRIGPPGAARTKDTAHVGFSDLTGHPDIGGFFSFSLRDKLPLGSKHHGRIRLEPLQRTQPSLLILELMALS